MDQDKVWAIGHGLLSPCSSLVSSLYGCSEDRQATIKGLVTVYGHSMSAEAILS